MVKISVRVKPERGRRVVGESLWAEPVGAGRYRLANVPLCVGGLSCRDVVFGKRRRNGVLTFAGVSLRGGHSTVWVDLHGDRDSESFRSRWADFRALGCSFESAGRALAVDVPPAADFRAVERLLEAGAAAGAWTYDVAHCGHLEEVGGAVAGKAKPPDP